MNRSGKIVQMYANGDVDVAPEDGGGTVQGPRALLKGNLVHFVEGREVLLECNEKGVPLRAHPVAERVPSPAQ